MKSTAARKRLSRQRAREGLVPVKVWTPRRELKCFLADAGWLEHPRQWAEAYLLAELGAGDTSPPGQMLFGLWGCRRLTVWLPDAALDLHLAAMPPSWFVRLEATEALTDASLWASAVLLDATREVPPPIDFGLPDVAVTFCDGAEDAGLCHDET